MIKEVITFKPKKVVKELLTGVPERAREIIKMRYGLENEERMTLEAIGKIYSITRERVRQIEDFTIKAIKKSQTMVAAGDVFVELESAVSEYGGIVHEAEFLDYLSPKDQVAKNNIHFLLVLGDAFSRLKEDEAFHHRWTVDADFSQSVHQSIKNLCQKLSDDDLLSEPEVINTFLNNLQDGVAKPEAEKHARRWLSLSKEIGQSPIGEWGLTRSPNVRVRGVRDYAYLVMRKHGSPMHFTEVAKAIEQTFGRKANPATCHNELIKDARFVLVGRGIYALAEWGYAKGVVRDVIRNLLEKHGPLSKEEILEKVMKERYVKENTILVNLKNPKHFKETKEGKFVAA
jgi:hypothetical protein